MFILTEQPSVANHYLAALRDINQQTDRLKFRRNLERLGELLAYEISRTLAYKAHSLQTPLAETQTELLEEMPVLIPVLRAALPFFEGFLNVFDESDAGFIGAYRNPHEGLDDLHIALNYKSAPELEGRQVILIDPMIATGKSLVEACEALLPHGKPAQLHVASVIAAPEGLAYLKENLALPFTFWTCAVDEKLNAKAYIVPGLGDAGDLAYGAKL